MQEKYLDLIEKKLESYLPGNDTLSEAMKYSLLKAGKRIRPLLLLEFCRICGGNVENALPFACALEMIHTSSLIHDDMPCMDDDDVRRGKSANHIKFGEAMALLAGDTLFTSAFGICTSEESTKNIELSRAVKATNILSDCSGINGMMKGQMKDLEHNGIEKLSAEEILDTYKEKTAKLLIAACKMGCTLAGASDEQLKFAENYALNLGLAFQITDDILDVVSDTQTLGKPVGSDSQNQKYTLISLWGLEKCNQVVQDMTQKSLDALSNFDGDTEFLKSLSLKLANRTN